MTTSKALIYTKISPSTPASVADQRQADMLKELAAADGYTDIAVLETRTPCGKPQHDQLIKEIETGAYAAIYVYDLTRIARDASMVREFLNTADKTGTELRIATMPGLSETPKHTRRIMIDMLLMFAERDVLDGSRRTRLGMTGKLDGYLVKKTGA